MRLETFQGDSFSIDVEFKEESENNEVVPIDLTGMKVIFILKKNLRDTEEVLRKDITSFTDPQNGKATISLTADETNLPCLTYKYEIILTDYTPNYVETFMIDDFVINPR